MGLLDSKMLIKDSSLINLGLDLSSEGVCSDSIDINDFNTLIIKVNSNDAADFTVVDAETGLLLDKYDITYQVKEKVDKISGTGTFLINVEGVKKIQFYNNKVLSSTANVKIVKKTTSLSSAYLEQDYLLYDKSYDLSVAEQIISIRRKISSGYSFAKLEVYLSDNYPKQKPSIKVQSSGYSENCFLSIDGRLCTSIYQSGIYFLPIENFSFSIVNETKILGLNATISLSLCKGEMPQVDFKPIQLLDTAIVDIAAKDSTETPEVGYDIPFDEDVIKVLLQNFKFIYFVTGSRGITNYNVKVKPDSAETSWGVIYPYPLDEEKLFESLKPGIATDWIKNRFGNIPQFKLYQKGYTSGGKISVALYGVR